MGHHGGYVGHHFDGKYRGMERDNGRRQKEGKDVNGWFCNGTDCSWKTKTNHINLLVEQGKNVGDWGRGRRRRGGEVAGHNATTTISKPGIHNFKSCLFQS